MICKGKLLSLFVLYTVCLVLLSCKAQPKQKPLIDGQSMTSSIHFEFAIYLPPGNARNPEVVLREMLGKSFPRLKLVDQLPDVPSEALVNARMREDLKDSYAPPSVEELAYAGHGLSKEQGDALQKSKRAFVLDFAHPREDVWVALRNANVLMEQLAGETGGMIWDEDTREVFTPAAWSESRLSNWTKDIPAIESQTTIHIYKKNEFVRAITLGMNKAGLPDVVVEEFDWSSENQVGNLINIFNQAMAEGATVKVPGSFTIDLKNIKDANVREEQMKSLGPNATGVGYLQLKPGTPDEGDPKNRLIELAFDRYQGTDPHARRERMIGCFFGFEDKTTHIEHTEELLAVSRKAKEQLPPLYAKFNAGLNPGEVVLVKAPFKTPNGGNEWMWVEITHWKNKRIRGVLENDPESIPDLHSGEIVEIREDDVFDYIHKFPDGHEEGNATGEIIRKMEKLPVPARPSPTMEELARRVSDSGCTPN